MKRFHGAGDVHEAQKRDVEVVVACAHAAKNLLALEKVFHRIASLASVLVQKALVLFVLDPAGDEDLHALTLLSLDKFVRVICFVSQKRLGLQPTQQSGTGMES